MEVSLFEIIEDFLERGANANSFIFNQEEHLGVYWLSYDGKQLTLIINQDLTETAIFEGRIALVMQGFVHHVLSTLKPTQKVLS